MGDGMIYLVCWFDYEDQTDIKAFKDLKPALKYKDELLVGRKAKKMKIEDIIYFHINDSSGVTVRTIPYISDA